MVVSRKGHVSGCFSGSCGLEVRPLGAPRNCSFVYSVKKRSSGRKVRVVVTDRGSEKWVLVHTMGAWHLIYCICLQDREIDCLQHRNFVPRGFLKVIRSVWKIF